MMYTIIAKQTKGDTISLNVTGLTGTEYGVSTFPLEGEFPFSSSARSMGGGGG